MARFQTGFSRLTILWVALTIILAGCGGAGQGVSWHSDGSATTEATGSVVVNFPEVRTLGRRSAQPDAVRFTGTDAAGIVLYGPQVEAWSPSVVLRAVPSAVTSIFVEPLVNGHPSDAYSYAVTVVPGSQVVIADGMDPSARATAITIHPVSPTVRVGMTQQLTATGSFPDGSSHDLSLTVAWAASPSPVATVSEAGLATGVGVGTATITASLDGVTGSTELTVTAVETTSTVLSSVNPSVVGQSVTFTVTVTSSGSASLGVPTGAVIFYDGANPLGNATLSGGQASVTTTTLLVATHSITAVYAGEGVFQGSTSAPLSQVVNRDTGGVSLGSSVAPAVYGQSVIFTARVTATPPGTGTPTGQVTFMDGTTSLGTVPLGSGEATCITTTLSVGTHSITAAYGGDGTFDPGVSAPLSQVVGSAPTTTTITSSSNPSTSGQSITFTAAVAATAPATGVPTGSVSFKDGSQDLGAGTLDVSGQATLSTGALSPGTHSITAVYNGDGNYLASTSNVLSQVVTLVFSYTGGAQSFVVPSGVTSVTITAAGASGGHSIASFSSYPGVGCIMRATIAVTPGDTLYVYAGGEGGYGESTAGIGGFNGGGTGGEYLPGGGWGGGGGGGASDVRRNVDDLDHRVMVAGGGGGSNGSFGGNGGGEAGGRGFPYADDWYGGYGGTQIAGGKGGLSYTNSSRNGEDGSQGRGGRGGSAQLGGGGGGGGYYGGGGGCAGVNMYDASGSGGGGSGYVIPGATNVDWNAGANFSNGQVTLSW